VVVDRIADRIADEAAVTTKRLPATRRSPLKRC
jgi:hypothetical protein